MVQDDLLDTRLPALEKFEEHVHLPLLRLHLQTKFEVHTAGWQVLLVPKSGVLRDYICTIRGLKVDCARQVDIR